MVCCRKHPDGILVHVGTSSLDEGGSFHEVTKIIPHANYNYDIALLKVRIIIIVLLDLFYQMCVCVYIYICEELTKMFHNRMPHSYDSTLQICSICGLKNGLFDFHP